MRAAITLALLTCCKTATATPQKLSFPSYDFTDASITSKQYLGNKVTLSGTLFMPQNATGKVPAMIVSHDSFGIQEAHEIAWAKLLVEAGVAAFVVDHFGARGVTDTGKNQDVVKTENVTIDQYEALRFLAGRADVDGKRIGVIGFSKGAVAAYFGAMQWYQQKLSPTATFAAYVPVYAECNLIEKAPKLSGGPMLMLGGALDTTTPTGPCDEFAKRARDAGYDVTLKIYANARHGFDLPGVPFGAIPSAQNFSDCPVYVDWPTGITSIKTGSFYPWGPSSDTFMKKCPKLGTEYGYDKAAHAAAIADVQAFVKKALK